MESQNDKQPTIPSTFTPHHGSSTPDLEYNTQVTVCLRDGSVQDGTLDDFDFNAKHEGYLSEIVGYRVRSDVLGTLGPAIGIAVTTPPPFGPVVEDLMKSWTHSKQPDITITKPVAQDNGTQYVPNLPKERSTTDDYKTLSDVLERAYAQAAHGKGKERHAQGQPFDRQPMQTISQLVGSCDGLRYQAIKKIQEAARLDHDAAIRELLGAINYIAGAIIYMEAQQPKEPKIHGVMLKDRESGEWKMFNNESDK